MLSHIHFVMHLFAWYATELHQIGPPISGPTHNLFVNVTEPRQMDSGLWFNGRALAESETKVSNGINRTRRHKNARKITLDQNKQRMINSSYLQRKFNNLN